MFQLNVTRKSLFIILYSSWIWLFFFLFFLFLGDRRPYQIFWVVVGLDRSPLSLVSTTEELLDRKVAVPVQKTENTAVGIRHADHVAPSIRKKLAIISPTSGCRSVGIVRSRTQTMKFSLVFCFLEWGEIVSTCHVCHCLAYCTSPGWW
jgi:hypothetical protein